VTTYLRALINPMTKTNVAIKNARTVVIAKNKPADALVVLTQALMSHFMYFHLIKKYFGYIFQASNLSRFFGLGF